jgi:FkbM family methyltransferase
VSDPTLFVSYAQHGEDVIIWRALGERAAGFYVDVGAFHPRYDSVTRALYARGWRGINIEPQPDRIAEFERERPEDTNLNVAIGDRDGTTTLTIPSNAGWASIVEPASQSDESGDVRALEVPIRRLDTLLAELGVTQVEVLKIDVEGAEPAVVRGLLGGPVRPLVCVVEGVAAGIGRTAGDEAVELLIGAGYLHCLFDGLNHYLTSDPALQPALSVPANPLDGYTTDLLSRLHHERRDLHATITALTHENLALRANSRSNVEMDVEPARRPEAGAEQETVQGFYGGDLPLPACGGPTAPDANGATLLPTPAHHPAPSTLDPELRGRRRRDTFARIIQSETSPLPRPTAPGPVNRLVQLATGKQTPGAAVSALYRDILGREADPDGHANWTARLEAGEPLLSLARTLADSPEALECAPEHRERVRSELVAWENLSAATELGVATWRQDRGYRPGMVAHQLFIDALFEVALQRPPSRQESAFEVSKLVEGVGRERLLRLYSSRPEVLERFLGRPVPGLRGRVRRWLDLRQVVETVRDLVTAAESRQIVQIVATLSTPVSVLDDRGRVQLPTSREG